MFFPQAVPSLSIIWQRQMCGQIIAVNVVCDPQKCFDRGGRNKGPWEYFTGEGGTSVWVLRSCQCCKKMWEGFLGSWNSLCKAKGAKSIACFRSVEKSCVSWVWSNGTAEL